MVQIERDQELSEKITIFKALLQLSRTPAITINELKNILAKAGFTDIVIEPQENSRMFIKDWVPGSDAENYVVSAKIKAVKPKARR